MKKTSLALNIILLITVAILYYLHFASKKSCSIEKPSVQNNTNNNNSFKVAYFEMDSLESEYGYIKEVRNELKNKQSDITAELNKLRKNYQSRITQLQEKASTMSQTEGEAAQREVYQMQQNLASKEQNLNQTFQEESFKKMQTVNNRIEEFLAKYNSDKGYAYIITNQPGFVYYKESKYNITKDVIDGLNAQYEQAKKKK